MKKTLLTVLQLAVTGGLLYWVFHDPAVRAAMGLAMRDADYRWIAAAILAYVIVEFGAIVRWKILLKVQGIDLSNARIAGLFFIGMFYNQFLPGGTGGDIVKTYLLWKETPRKKTGRVARGPLRPDDRAHRADHHHGRPDFPALRLADEHKGDVPVRVAGARGLRLLGFVCRHDLRYQRLRSHAQTPHRFPGREKLIEISAAYHLYARHWRATIGAFGASLVCHLGTFATFLCVAYAFQANVAPIDFFAIMPIERTISSLPISFAGVGTREFILQVMLSNLCAIPSGAPADYWFAAARLIGLTGFTVLLLCSLPGGIVYFFYRPSGATGHVKMREMKEEFATLEHEITREGRIVPSAPSWR